METFDNIELSEAEIEEALRRGREEKYYEIQRKEYNERLKRDKTYPKYSADQLYDYYKMQFEIDEFNGSVVSQLCFYFSNDSSFQGDLNKGLFLMGGVGVGKTSIMKFFARNQRLSYRMEPCRDVEMNYGSLGDEYLQKVSTNLPISVNADPFGHTNIGFCFDDLGTEADGKNYGKSKNVMAEVLLNRYDNNLLYDEVGNPVYTHTHVTTNLTADQIKAQYGSRVTDRIREMFNVIKFSTQAKSRRG